MMLPRKGFRGRLRLRSRRHPNLPEGSYGDRTMSVREIAVRFVGFPSRGDPRIVHPSIVWDRRHHPTSKRSLLVCLSILSILLSLAPVAPAGAASGDGSTLQRAPARRIASEVQTLWTNEFGEPHPTGVAYLPRTGEFLTAQVKSGGTRIVRLSPTGQRQGSLLLPRVSNPSTIAFDAAHHRVAVIGGHTLFTVRAGTLDTDHPRVRRTNISDLGLGRPRAATFAPRSGTWFVLDGSAIVRVRSGPSPRVTGRIPLGRLGGTQVRAIAFNPEDGLLYVANPSLDRLYAVSRSGARKATYDIHDLRIRDLRAMTFAPSADSTDDASVQDLYVVDNGTSSRDGGVMEVRLTTSAFTPAATTVAATLVQTVATSNWNPASPDPSGVEYLPGVDRLIVCDSEVDETTGAGYHNVNMWTIRRTGVVTDTGTTWNPAPAFSKEPTGLGYDPNSNTLFISDDSAKKVWVDKTGPDNRFGTSDDNVSFVEATQYGSNDTEDPEFQAKSGLPSTGHLFFLDGVNTEVYNVDPVDGVFGNGNDTMTHFDVGYLGPSDWEGLGSDPSTGNLLVGARTTRQIFEVTPTGALVRTITLPNNGIDFVSGLQMAPASDDSGRMDYYVVDRRVDNGPSPNENDGKMFEYSIPSSDNPPTVSITSPHDGDTISGTTTITANANDDHGVTKVDFYDGNSLIGTDNNSAGGWTFDWDTTGVSNTTHTLKAVATDTVNQTGTSTNVSVTVDNTTDNPPTASITSPSNGDAVKGTVTITANASDDHGVDQVEFFDGSTSIGTDTNGGDGWSASWDTTSVSAGTHTLTATATDTTNQTGTSLDVNVTVDNADPTVSISSPAPLAIVSGTITVSANADGTGSNVASVQFFNDGISIGTDSNSSGGWSVQWNTVGTGNGTHNLTATATDAAGNTGDSAPVTVTVNNGTGGTLDIPIATSAGDAEQQAGGSVTLTSTDLDMMIDGASTQQAVGLRFTNVQVPQGATITSAYIQFQTNDISTGSSSLTIRAQAVNNAPAFRAKPNNITKRAQTNASQIWTPPDWTTVGAHGTDQQTSNMNLVIQRVVRRGGWAPGNAIVIIITGSGKRTAEAFDGGKFAPVLHIEFSTL